jgi:hypothetical protein
MTKYLDTFFEQKHLMELQGYRLQVFASGRVKLSFLDVGNRSVEYYAEWPKRDAEAYRRQHKRSVEHAPHHFELVDTLRAESKARTILRVHAKGDNNKTADNAHVLINYSTDECIVVLNTLIQTWELPSKVLHAFYERNGPRHGASSVFNEYMPSYEHDWEDATFDMCDYRQGFRSPKIHQHPSHAINNDDHLLF